MSHPPIGAASSNLQVSSEADDAAGAIAIVGMSGRFPGAPSVGQFWEALVSGAVSIRTFTDAELDDNFSAEARASDSFVKARSILDGVDQFDAAFFGMQPTEAALTDPQQRLFLELCWHALEDAGWDPGAVKGAIGIYAGSSLNTYFLRHVLSDRAAIETFTSNLQVGSYGELLGALHDFLPTRVAYKLDLRGPAVALQTACSTSLTAVIEACKSLMVFECDMALAGGVSITFPQHRGYHHLEGGMVSADGQCRPFDAKASGTVFGDGAGVVVLKRLEDARADGDTIHAVIRGWGLNNDGKAKAGFTAPSSEGQARVIAAAHAMAGIDPATIDYVECHGTATPLGDPIEFAGLQMAFGAAPRVDGPCWLGSAKGNLGHLDAAAGVTGLIKTVLMLKNATIPPLVNFQAPNPNMDVAASPFAFNKELLPWQRRGTPRRGGVSAFGVGGTNAHVVLEEAPPSVARHASKPAQPMILTVSARSPAALQSAIQGLAAHLEKAKTQPISDVAFTLQHGRRLFACRTAIAAETHTEAIAQLRGWTPPAVSTSPASGPPPIVLLFPGQGAQRRGMARSIVERHALARTIIESGLARLDVSLQASVRDYLLASPVSGSDNDSDLTPTRIVQPALFLTEYALARCLISHGVTPSAMIGHSLGEFVAAALSGVMSFEEALDFVALRGALMQEQPPGAMLAVRLAAEDLTARLPAGVEIAAINAPALCTLAGPLAAIAAFEARLAVEGVAVRRLRTSHAFHSAMMDPVVAPLEALARRMRLSAPDAAQSQTCISTVTGSPLTAAEATDPVYWARHSRLPVRFAAATQTALNRYPGAVVLDIGPGEGLASLVAQVRGATKPLAIIRGLGERLAETAEADLDADPITMALAQLWSHGAAVDIDAFIPQAGLRVSLPGYPFERKRHWIDLPVASPPSVLENNSTAEAFDMTKSNTVNIAQQPKTIAGVSMPLPKDTREANVVALLEDMTGAALADATSTTSFFDLGYDSLFMAQIATQLQKRFKVKITFRQLMRDHSTIGAVAKLLPEPQAASIVAAAPPSAPHVSVPTQTVAAVPAPPPIAATAPRSSIPLAADTNSVERIVREQLAALQQIMGQQLQAVSGTASSQAVVSAPVVTPAVAAPPVAMSVTAPAATAPLAAVVDQSAADLVALGERQSAARLKVYGQKSTAQAEMTVEQRRFIAATADRYSRKMQKTKTFVQAHRHHLADPRTAAGFRADWKEMVFPIVAERAIGSKIWDLDGNEYVDLVNGYGQTMFGHTPSFVTDAVSRQLHDGFPIGPQTPLAGEVAELFCRATGSERVTFCNTGSEAVMAAMRLARTVTGRDRIVSFAGDYHGQFDEVLVKGALQAGQPGAAPFCPGIPDQSVANMVVLPYGHAESLKWIKAHADDLAAVLVEPIQSRHPGMQPVEFLRDLRAITAQAEVCLIMDEIVTGFRIGIGGAQAHFGIKGDLATYGKVVGGGMPIGVLAGKAIYMDALDGGTWSFGDDSGPEVAPTFFAGTFVRHPIALAAARAVLSHLEREGPALYDKLTATTTALVARLNTALVQRGLPACLEQCASWFYFDLSGQDRLASLLYAHMRLLGVHIQEGFPCFLTTAHSAADIAFIEHVFCDSLDALQAQGILKSQGMLRETGASVAASGRPARPLQGPLTEPQQEIYLIAQLGDRASCVYNESITLEFDGDLKADALHRALNDLIARHDALRATFTATGETMRVAPILAIELPLVDLSLERDKDATFRALLKSEADKPFDLEAGPLVRATLVRRASASHALVLSCHHMICDGWSMGILLNEMSALYGQHLGKAPAELPPPASFLAYTQSRAAETTVDAAADAYWLGQYTTLPSPLELPADRIRPVQKSYAGATATAHFDGALQAGIKKAGARANATLFAVLFAALQTTLGRLAENSDVVLAVPAGGQALLDEQTLVGHCVNFLPIRAPFDFNEPFEKHLERARQAVFSALDHQDYTLGTLVRNLDAEGRGGHEPLTRVQFNLERLGENLAFDGLKTSMAPTPKSAVHFDLFFNFIEGADGIRVDVDYSEELFDAATIARWIGHLRTLLEGVAANPQTPISDLPLLTKSEIARQLIDLNRSAVSVPAFRFTHERVAEQAARTPDAPAVIFNDKRLTYRQLNNAAEELATRIRVVAPTPGQRIAVLLERSADLPVALLAVWKAGHAYVPLDPTHPEARLSAILATAKVAAVIADRLGQPACVPKDVPILVPGNGQQTPPATAAPKLSVSTDAIAFMIFTSGSTGTPKGVEVLHRSLDNVLCSVRGVLDLTENDHWLALSTIAFDVAQGELFLPLTSGGVVEIATSEDVREGFPIAKRLKDPTITISHATPSLWQILHEAGFQPRSGLRLGYTGEPIARALADKLTAGGHTLWNMYAPAETTIWSTVDRVLPEGVVNCVKAPIANTELFVLDARKHLAPVGVIGELWIGGAGVAKGYFERQDITEAAFQSVTLEDGKPRRLYRTGDVASRRGDNWIQLHGRRDHQVKLSGYRIELQEIEHVLRRHPAIADCAATVHAYPDGDRRLVGYYTLNAGVPAAPAAFATHLGTLLPPYMVPSLWKALEAMPLNPNGKLDRKALPVVDRAEALTSTVVQMRPVAKPVEEDVKPPEATQLATHSDVMAMKIAKVWGAVLGVTDIPHDQPLLALGARSLHLFRIAARLQEAGLTVTARRLMANPTIDDLVAQLRATAATTASVASPAVATPSLREFKRGSSRASEAPS